MRIVTDYTSTLEPLTALQENAVCQSTIGSDMVIAQPMTGWSLLVFAHWSAKRFLSTQVAKAFCVDHKTLQAGLPRGLAKLHLSFEGLDRHLDEGLSRAEPAFAARRVRALNRAQRLLQDEPQFAQCTLFHQSFGTYGDDLLEALSIAIDEVSVSILRGQVSRDAAATRIVAAAEETGVVAVGTMHARPDLDPGLDALLALTARLDRDLAPELLQREDCISSVFGLLVDLSDSGKRRGARRRLLDIYYALARGAASKPLPDTLPSIRELEDALLGGPQKSGGQSLITRWRSTDKHLRLEDVNLMSCHVATKSGTDIGWHFTLLWIVAKLWDLIEATGERSVMISGERYGEWWAAMDNPGREPASLTSAYWQHFAPHA